MSEIHVLRIKSLLQKEFDGLIDLSDLGKFSEEDRENHFLTRSQAAFAVSYLAEIENIEATKFVCDGFGDDGIDAIFFDEEAKIVYVVQSKWTSGGVNSPDLGSIEKFIKGFKDLIAGKFDRFNDKVRKQQDNLEATLLDPNVTFILVLR